MDTYRFHACTGWNIHLRSLHTYVSCNHEGRLTTRMCIHAWNIHTATLPGRNTQSRSVCCDYSDEGSCCSGRWRSYLSCAFFHSVFPQEGKNKLYARLCLWLQRLYLKFDRLRERCFHKNDQKKKKIFKQKMLMTLESLRIGQKFQETDDSKFYSVQHITVYCMFTSEVGIWTVTAEFTSMWSFCFIS